MFRPVGILFIYIKMASPLICLSLFCLGSVALTKAFAWTTAKVSPVRTTWQQGLNDPKCHLFGRELVDDRIEDIRVEGVTADEGLSDQYWIGAHVQYTKWIRLTGCYKTNVQGNTSNLSGLSVTECYKFCGGTSFGLSSERCVCLNSRRNVRYRYCMASPCPVHTDEFCGNDGINPLRICLCIYEVIDLPSDNEIGNCKTITFDVRVRQPPLVTTHCSEEHNFLCNKYFGGFFPGTKATNWSEAGFACHREENKKLYSGKYRRRSKKYSGSYWVSVFRKQTLSWGNDTPQGTEFDCLAVSVNTDGTLNPFVRKCYSKLPLLCDEPEENQSTDDTNVSIPANKGESQSSSAVEPEKISVFSLFIGVACGILVTVLTLIISVIIYRYRKKRIVAQASQNRPPEVDIPESLGVHYEHLRPENREGNIYDVCGHSSVSYDHMSAPGCSGQYQET